MGRLVDGQWTENPDLSQTKAGRFVRQESIFRNWITPGGEAGPTGAGGFKAEAGRYHLYVAMCCPWAHRTLIFRKLKGLEDAISLSVVNPITDDRGWTFFDGHGVIADAVNGSDYFYQIYLKNDPHYTGRVTVPTLWDKARGVIVSNESSEIIRMFNSAFDGVGAREGDYYPARHRAEIDEVNDLVYQAINNGVYRTGFAKTQEAYEEAYTKLFDALDALEERLAGSRYLAGSRITEADWRLFTTLVRFDAAYYGHFKCNKRRIVDYPNLWAYVRDLYQTPGIAETVDLVAIKQHYHQSTRMGKLAAIFPLGPEIEFDQAHGRG